MRRRRARLLVAVVRPGLSLLVVAGALVLAAQAGALGRTAGFFGAGGALLRGRPPAARRLGPAAGGRAVDLGHDAACGRSGARTWPGGPTRTVLTVSLIAFATFVLVSVVAFRRDAAGASLARESGTGGFVLLAEAAVPLMHDPNTPAGLASLGLDAERDARGASDAPATPSGGRSELPDALPAAQPAHRRRQPRRSRGPLHVRERRGQRAWRLAVARCWTRPCPTARCRRSSTRPHSPTCCTCGVGDAFSFAPDGVNSVTLRIVASLADSVLQSEMIIGERAFVRLFPRHEGYRVWLIEAPEARATELATTIEDRLADSGVDVVDTRARLASYHRVENTYLATFQALGALGPAAGHARRWRGAGPERARTAARVGPVAGGRLRAGALAATRDLGERGAGAGRRGSRQPCRPRWPWRPRWPNVPSRCRCGSWRWCCSR